MIYELQSYTLVSRSLGTVESRLEHALLSGDAPGALVACWRTEVGMLNTLLLLWAHENADALARAQNGGARIDGWLSDIKEYVLEQSTRRLIPAPFSPVPEPAALGNLYEIRIYTYQAADIPGVIESWQEIIAPRVKVSPLVLAAYTEATPQCEWVHIWAYKDAADRDRVRDAVTQAGIWPISVVDRRLKRAPRAVSLRMQNMLAVPLRLSPLR